MPKKTNKKTKKQKNKKTKKQKNQRTGKQKKQGTEKQKNQKTGEKKDQSTNEMDASWLGPMLLWALCICMLLFGIAFIVTARNAYFILTGLLGLLLAAMLCPYITARTRDVPFLSVYYRFRTVIIILLFVLLFVTLYFSVH